LGFAFALRSWNWVVTRFLFDWAVHILFIWEFLGALRCTAVQSTAPRRARVVLHSAFSPIFISLSPRAEPGMAWPGLVWSGYDLNDDA
jgi:hypothetical protein